MTAGGSLRRRHHDIPDGFSLPIRGRRIERQAEEETHESLAAVNVQGV